MNRSKAIGTRAESCVVELARRLHFPMAERLALKGNADHGDVRLCRGLHVEVKGGKAAEAAGPQLIEDWMLECEVEAENSRSLVFLARKRRGCGKAQVSRWHAHLRLEWLVPSLHGTSVGNVIVEMPLGDALSVFAHQGHGERERIQAREGELI